MSCKCDLCGKRVSAYDLTPEDGRNSFLPRDKDICSACEEEVAKLVSRIFVEQNDMRDQRVRGSVAALIFKKEIERGEG